LEEAIAWMLVIVAVVVLFAFAAKYVVWGVFWFLAALAHLFFTVCDALFSAPLVPGAPWVMWLVWGAVIGAAQALWSVAPIYGLRKQRGFIIGAPFALMLVVMGIRLLARG